MNLVMEIMMTDTIMRMIIGKMKGTENCCGKENYGSIKENVSGVFFDVIGNFYWTAHIIDY